MEAVEYLKHWKPLDKVRLLGCAKHQKRLSACAGYMEGEKFIDVGCAEGHSTEHLKKFHPGEWTGADFCKKTIAGARAEFKDIDFKYIKDIQSIPSAGIYDGVICSEVIEHVEDDQLLVDKLMEITGKVLVITTPSKKVTSVGHLRTYTKDSLLKLFTKYEFEFIYDSPFFYVVVHK